MTDPTETPVVAQGFSDAERPRAAGLYWEAFGAKLGRVLGPAERGIGFVAEAMDPNYALAIRAGDGGALLGVAGFKTEAGAFVGGGWGDLRRHYGLFGGLWRAPLLELLERKPRPGELLMDGILVAQEARGRGLGTLLLDAIKSEALARGARRVRLDVIDSNPRARALYTREGFRPVKTEHIGPLKAVFGFEAATEMLWTAPDG